MEYLSAYTADLGSSSSGCARIDLCNDKFGEQSTYQRPNFIQASPYYAKDDTWFFVSPDLWQRITGNYGSLADADFKIMSRVFPNTKNPNIVWGRVAIGNYADVIEKEGWIGFKRFKMKLYHHEDYVVGGMEFPIKEVVRVFLRILKIECLEVEKGRRRTNVTQEQIKWGVTIPTIWTDDEKAVMTEVASDVFGGHVRILSEPEGPVLSSLAHATGDGRFALIKGRVSLVVDAGGGTTDITLVEEVSDDPTCEYPLRTLAATDGAGIGGNNIDDAYWTYILRKISNSCTNDDATVNYNNLSDDELKQCLLEPFAKRLKDFIELENKWFDYKHGNAAKVNFTPAYRRWLKDNGHKQVADFLTKLMIGEEVIADDELYENVFAPTFNKIYDKVKGFIEVNRDKIPSDGINFVLIKAGGLSLSSKLCDVIDRVSNDLGIKYTSGSLASDSLSASGSIMDGACIVLLNRKIINRIAPCTLYISIDIDLLRLKSIYQQFGIEFKLGQLNNMYDEDKKCGAFEFVKARPVAIKGYHFIDDTVIPVSRCYETQKEGAFRVFGTDTGYVVLPLNNPNCYELGSATFDTSHSENFTITIDFNESSINNNLHYYIIPENSNDILDEGNIPLQRK